MTGVDAPVLETERLILRGPTADDFPAFAAMWADPEVTRYITGDPLGGKAAWSGFLRIAGHWPIKGFGYWMVFDRSTNEFLGEVGFVDFIRDMTPPIVGEPEIGWVFDRRAHGRGIATEAALAAVAWGDRHFKSQRMSCIIDPPNAASLRVAAKCGFEKTALGRYKDEDIIVLHRDIPA